MGVIRKSLETPLHPPCQGDRRLRQANQKPHVEYWHELLAYIDSQYVKKFGQHYPWNNLARRNLWNIARAHSAWGVMAFWDLYLESESWWAVKTTWSVYGMMRDAGRLMDDSRFKQLAAKQEETLARQRYGRFGNSSDVIKELKKLLPSFREEQASFSRRDQILRLSTGSLDFPRPRFSETRSFERDNQTFETR